MKIMMTIVMKNTKVSQDLLRQINNFMPLLHKTAGYNFHSNYHCSRVITYTISFKPSLQLPRSWQKFPIYKLIQSDIFKKLTSFYVTFYTAEIYLSILSYFVSLTPFIYIYLSIFLFFYLIFVYIIITFSKDRRPL